MKQGIYCINVREARRPLTPLGRVDDDIFAERPVALVVVNSHFDFERCERGKRLVSVLVRRGVRRGHHLLLPASGAVGAEGDDVPEPLAVLELLRHGLKISEKKKKMSRHSGASDWFILSLEQLVGAGTSPGQRFFSARPG